MPLATLRGPASCWAPAHLASLSLEAKNYTPSVRQGTSLEVADLGSFLLAQILQALQALAVEYAIHEYPLCGMSTWTCHYATQSCQGAIHEYPLWSTSTLLAVVHTVAVWMLPALMQVAVAMLQASALSRPPFPVA